MDRPTHPMTNRYRRSVGVFPDRRSAEQALYELKDSGFPINRVSVITQDDQHHDDLAAVDVRDQVGLGISEEHARVYQDRISRGGYLVIVEGTDADIASTEAILHRRGIEEYGVYDAPTAHASTKGYSALSGVPTTHTSATTYTSTPSKASRAPLSRRSAVNFFSNLSDVEYGVTELRSVGFPLSQITLVANHFRRQDQFAGVDLCDRFEAARLEISAEQACFYQDRLGRGEYMVIVHGTEDELNRAASILNHRMIQEWQMCNSTVVNNGLPVEAFRETVAASVALTSRISDVDRPH